MRTYKVTMTGVHYVAFEAEVEANNPREAKEKALDASVSEGVKVVTAEEDWLVNGEDPESWGEEDDVEE